MNREVTLNVKRIAPRCYDVVISDSITSKERTFDNANAAYAAHVTLREYIYDNPNVEIDLKTNSNNLLADIQSLDESAQTKSLTRILKDMLDKNNVTILTAVYKAAN